MNSVLENLLNRRSVRSYTAEQIKEDDLNTILEAGKYAATGHGIQPWHFTVVQNQDLLSEIVASTKEAILASDDEVSKARITPEYHTFYHAPTVIFVSANPSMSPYSSLDASNAMENMLLAASSLGLASCYIINFIKGLTPELLKKLQLPEGYTPVASVAIGYLKGDTPQAAPRRENTITYIR